MEGKPEKHEKRQQSEQAQVSFFYYRGKKRIVVLATFCCEEARQREITLPTAEESGDCAHRIKQELLRSHSKAALVTFSLRDTLPGRFENHQYQ